MAAALDSINERFGLDVFADDSKQKDTLQKLLKNGLYYLTVANPISALVAFSSAASYLYSLQQNTTVENAARYNNTMKTILGYVEKLQDETKNLTAGGNKDKEEEVDDWNVECETYCEEDPSKNTLTFADVIGMEKEKEQIFSSIVYPIVYPNLYTKTAKGVLLYGPPGTGKTYLIKAAIKELGSKFPQVGVHFFPLTGADLKGKYVGETEKKIVRAYTCAARRACQSTDVFNTSGPKKCKTADDVIRDAKKAFTATENKDAFWKKQRQYISVIFIDEFDAIGGDRSKDDTGMVANAVNTMLQMMDGLQSFSNIVTVCATNYPWNLDAALIRRFSSQIFCNVPNLSDVVSLVRYDMKSRLKYIEDNKQAYCATKVNKIFNPSNEMKQKYQGIPDDIKGDKEKEKAFLDNEKRRIKERDTILTNFFNQDYIRDKSPETMALFHKMWEDRYSNSDITQMMQMAYNNVSAAALNQSMWFEFEMEYEGEKLQFYVPSKLANFAKSAPYTGALNSALSIIEDNATLDTNYGGSVTQEQYCNILYNEAIFSYSQVFFRYLQNYFESYINFASSTWLQTFQKQDLSKTVDKSKDAFQYTSIIYTIFKANYDLKMALEEIDTYIGSSIASPTGVQQSPSGTPLPGSNPGSAGTSPALQGQPQGLAPPPPPLPTQTDVDTAKDNFLSTIYPAPADAAKKPALNGILSVLEQQQADKQKFIDFLTAVRGNTLWVETINDPPAGFSVKDNLERAFNRYLTSPVLAVLQRSPTGKGLPLTGGYQVGGMDLPRNATAKLAVAPKKLRSRGGNPPGVSALPGSSALPGASALPGVASASSLSGAQQGQSVNPVVAVVANPPAVAKAYIAPQTRPIRSGVPLEDEIKNILQEFEDNEKDTNKRKFFEDEKKNIDRFLYKQALQKLDRSRYDLFTFAKNDYLFEQARSNRIFTFTILSFLQDQKKSIYDNAKANFESNKLVKVTSGGGVNKESYEEIVQTGGEIFTLATLGWAVAGSIVASGTYWLINTLKGEDKNKEALLELQRKQALQQIDRPGVDNFSTLNGTDNLVQEYLRRYRNAQYRLYDALIKKYMLEELITINNGFMVSAEKIMTYSSWEASINKDINKKISLLSTDTLTIKKGMVFDIASSRSVLGGARVSKLKGDDLQTVTLSDFSTVQLEKKKIPVKERVATSIVYQGRKFVNLKFIKNCPSILMFLDPSISDIFYDSVEVDILTNNMELAKEGKPFEKDLTINLVFSKPYGIEYSSVQPSLAGYFETRKQLSQIMDEIRRKIGDPDVLAEKSLVIYKKGANGKLEKGAKTPGGPTNFYKNVYKYKSERELTKNEKEAGIPSEEYVRKLELRFQETVRKLWRFQRNDNEAQYLLEQYQEWYDLIKKTDGSENFFTLLTPDYGTFKYEKQEGGALINPAWEYSKFLLSKDPEERNISYFADFIVTGALKRLVKEDVVEKEASGDYKAKQLVVGENTSRFDFAKKVVNFLYTNNDFVQIFTTYEQGALSKFLRTEKDSFTLKTDFDGVLQVLKNIEAKLEKEKIVILNEDYKNLFNKGVLKPDTEVKNVAKGIAEKIVNDNNLKSFFTNKELNDLNTFIANPVDIDTVLPILGKKKINETFPYFKNEEVTGAKKILYFFASIKPFSASWTAFRSAGMYGAGGVFVDTYRGAISWLGEGKKMLSNLFFDKATGKNKLQTEQLMQTVSSYLSNTKVSTARYLLARTSAVGLSGGYDDTNFFLKPDEDEIRKNFKKEIATQGAENAKTKSLGAILDILDNAQGIATVTSIYTNLLETADDVMKKVLQSAPGPVSQASLRTVFQKISTIKSDSNFWARLQEAIVKTLVDSLTDPAKVGKTKAIVEYLVSRNPYTNEVTPEAKIYTANLKKLEDFYNAVRAVPAGAFTEQQKAQLKTALNLFVVSKDELDKQIASNKFWDLMTGAIKSAEEPVAPGGGGTRKNDKAKKRKQTRKIQESKGGAKGSIYRPSVEAVHTPNKITWFVLKPNKSHPKNIGSSPTAGALVVVMIGALLGVGGKQAYEYMRTPGGIPGETQGVPYGPENLPTVIPYTPPLDVTVNVIPGKNNETLATGVARGGARTRTEDFSEYSPDESNNNESNNDKEENTPPASETTSPNPPPSTDVSGATPPQPTTPEGKAADKETLQMIEKYTKGTVAAAAILAMIKQIVSRDMDLSPDNLSIAIKEAVADVTKNTALLAGAAGLGGFIGGPLGATLLPALVGTVIVGSSIYTTLYRPRQAQSTFFQDIRRGLFNDIIGSWCYLQNPEDNINFVNFMFSVVFGEDTLELEKGRTSDTSLIENFSSMYDILYDEAYARKVRPWYQQIRDDSILEYDNDGYINVKELVLEDKNPPDYSKYICFYMDNSFISSAIKAYPSTYNTVTGGQLESYNKDRITFLEELAKKQGKK